MDLSRNKEGPEKVREAVSGQKEPQRDRDEVFEQQGAEKVLAGIPEEGAEGVPGNVPGEETEGVPGNVPGEETEGVPAGVPGEGSEEVPTDVPEGREAPVFAAGGETPFMRCIGEVWRCANLYRTARYEGTELGSYQDTYIVHVCRPPGITQEQLAGKIYVHKSNVARQLSALAVSYTHLTLPTIRLG